MDLMDIERVHDIHRIFKEINDCKSQVAELPELKDQYADTVNEFYDISVDNSQAGEEIAARALALGKQIEEAWKARERITVLEQELVEKYGFLSPEEKAA